MSETFDYLELASKAASLIIFCTFVGLIFRHLQRTKQKLDGYMKVTLAFLFISLIFGSLTLLAALIDDIKESIFWKRLLIDYLPGIPSQICEKIGIFFDIARLAVIVAVMRDKRERISLIHRVLAC